VRPAPLQQTPLPPAKASRATQLEGSAARSPGNNSAQPVRVLLARRLQAGEGGGRETRPQARAQIQSNPRRAPMATVNAWFIIGSMCQRQPLCLEGANTCLLAPSSFDRSSGLSVDEIGPPQPLASSLTAPDRPSGAQWPVGRPAGASSPPSDRVRRQRRQAGRWTREPLPAWRLPARGVAGSRPTCLPLSAVARKTRAPLRELPSSARGEVQGT